MERGKPGYAGEDGFFDLNRFNGSDVFGHSLPGQSSCGMTKAPKTGEKKLMSVNPAQKRRLGGVRA